MISLQQYLDFDREYFAGKHPHQRYGQAFCNKFNITNPDLFFNTKTEECITLAFGYIKGTIAEKERQKMDLKNLLQNNCVCTAIV